MTAHASRSQRPALRPRLAVRARGTARRGAAAPHRRQCDRRRRPVRAGRHGAHPLPRHARRLAPHRLRRRPVPAGEGRLAGSPAARTAAAATCSTPSRAPTSARAPTTTPGPRLQLRLQPVVRLRPLVGVPARAAGQHPPRGDPGRRADAALTRPRTAGARTRHPLHYVLQRDERAACVVETLPGRSSSEGAR